MIVATSATSTTTLAALTSTITTSVTSTIYTTYYPTTYVISTSALAYISASSTSYAADATYNIVSTANDDKGISLVGGVGTDSVGYSDMSGIYDAYDCCVACQTYTGDCDGFDLRDRFLRADYVLYTTCNATTFDTDFETSSSIANGDDFTIGNRPYGQILDTGAE